MHKEYLISPDFSIRDEVYWLNGLDIDDDTSDEVTVRKGRIMNINATISETDIMLRYYVSISGDFPYIPLFKGTIYISEKDAEQALTRIHNRLKYLLQKEDR